MVSPAIPRRCTKGFERDLLDLDEKAGRGGNDHASVNMCLNSQLYLKCKTFNAITTVKLGLLFLFINFLIVIICFSFFLFFFWGGGSTLLGFYFSIFC